MMKKIFALIVVAAAMAVPAHAQFAFGAKAGLNLTQMTGDVKKAVDNKAGFFIGPTVKFTFPVVGLSIDGAALYDQRSADAKADDGTKTSLKQQSIQIPINLRYGIGLGSVLNVFAFAGPQFGFNIGDKVTSIKAAQQEVGQWKLKSSNLSANVGVGATILKHLQATVNYNIALGKTGEASVKTAANSVYDTVKGGKANSWQIAVAYYF